MKQKTAVPTSDMSSISGIANKVVDWREEKRTSNSGALLSSLSQLSSIQGGGGGLNGYQEYELEVELDEIPCSELFSVNTLDELAERGNLIRYFSNLFVLSSSNRPACSVRRDQLALAMVSTAHRLVEDNGPLLSKDGKEIVGRKKTAKDLLELLVPELDSLTSTAICALVEIVLKPGISRWEIGSEVYKEDTVANVSGFLLVLQLLPKLLGLLMMESSLPACSYVPSDLVNQPGSMLVDESLAKLCGVTWPRRCAAAIIECIRDAPTNEARRETVVMCGLKCLYQIAESFSAVAANGGGCDTPASSISAGSDQIELNEIPPLVHQLLLISSRKCAGFPVAGVCRMFDSLHSWSGGHSDEVAKVEGTVLLQFQYVMRQDTVLADAVLSTLQLQPDETSKPLNSQGSRLAFGMGFQLPSPFRLALLMSLSTLQRFQNKVMNELCSRFHAMVVHEIRCCRSPWLAQLSQSYNCKSSGPYDVTSLSRVLPSHGGLSGSVSRLISSALLSLARSSRGWDTLFPSLVLLGRRLLELGGKDCIINGKESFYARLNASESLHSHHQLTEVGRALLLESFTQHQPSRRGLLTAALHGSIGLTTGAIQHVRVLGDIAKVAPQLLLDEGDCIRKTLVEVGSMPPRIAQILLEVLRPLLHLRPSLQDTLMIPLRKALFNRDVGARTVAVYGLTALVRAKMNLCRQRSAQQVEGSVGNRDMQAFTLAEGFDLLRRCLSQQPDLREVLYDELVKIYKSEGVSDELRVFILTLLHRHMRHYIAGEHYIVNEDIMNPPHRIGGTVTSSKHHSSSTSLPPLFLDRAIDGSCIVEPLPTLLGALGSLQIHHHKKSPSFPHSPFTPIDPNTILTGANSHPSPSTIDLEELHKSLASDMNFILQGVMQSPLEAWEVCKSSSYRHDKSAAHYLSRAVLLAGVVDVLACTVVQLNGDKADNSVSCHQNLPKAASHLLKRKLEVLELIRMSVSSLKVGKQVMAPGKRFVRNCRVLEDNNNGEAYDKNNNTQEAIEQKDTDTQWTVSLPSKSLSGVSDSAVSTTTVLPDHLPYSSLNLVARFLSAMNTSTDDDENLFLLDTALVQHILTSARWHLNEIHTCAPLSLSTEMGGGVLSSTAAGSTTLQDGPSAALLHSRALAFAHSLAPLLLREFEHSRADGKSSYRLLQEAATKKNKKASPDESLAEIALSGFGICVRIASEDIFNPTKEVESLLAASLERISGSYCVAVPAETSEESSIIHSTATAATTPRMPRLATTNNCDTQNRLISHLKSLANILDVLLEEDDSKEAVLLLQICQRIVTLVADNRPLTPSSCADLKPHFNYLYGLCTSCKIKAPTLAKELISALLQSGLASQPMGGSLEILQVVSSQIAQCMGSMRNHYPNRKDGEGGGSDSDDDTSSCEKSSSIHHSSFACIHKEIVCEATGKESKGTVDLVCDSLITCMDGLMQEVEGAVDCLVKASGSLTSGMKMKKILKYTDKDDNEHSNSEMDLYCGAANLVADGLDRSLDALESLICVRLNNILKAIQIAISSRLRNASAEKILKVVLRGQRTLGKVLSARCRTARGWVSEGLKLLLNNRRTFCKQVHIFLLGFHKATITAGTHSDTKKHSRIVPDLLYQTENCDRLVINLVKLHEVSPKISRWIFNAQARDFKIDHDRATDIMAGMSVAGMGKGEKRARTTT